MGNRDSRASCSRNRVTNKLARSFVVVVQGYIIETLLDKFINKSKPVSARVFARQRSGQRRVDLNNRLKPMLISEKLNGKI